MNKQLKILMIIPAAMMISRVSVICQPIDFFDTSFYSSILEETKNMRIYLPPGYNDDTCSYPVVFYLHCAGSNYEDLINYMPKIHDMIMTGYIHPMLVVGLDGACGPFAGSLYTNSVLYGDYEDYIIQEAIPFAESVLRAENSPDYRSIMGFAMGGYGSMSLALKHTGMFAATASYNSPLQLDTMMVLWQPEVLAENTGPPYHYLYGSGIFTSLTFTASGAWSPDLLNYPYPVEFLYDTLGLIVNSVFQKWKPHDCARLAKNVLPGSYYPSIFFGCGINDFLYFHPTNVCFADTLDELGMDYKFLTTDDGHILSDEMLEAGMFFLDSVMFDNYWIGEKEFVPVKSPFLHLYPNPCKGSLYVQYECLENQKAELRIFDFGGKEVFHLGITGKKSGLCMEKTNLSDLSTGLFLIQYAIGNQRVSKKFIKQ